MFKERRTRPRQTSADLLRFVLTVKLRKPRGKLKLKVSLALGCYPRFQTSSPHPPAKAVEAEAKKQAQLAKRTT
jgi:hypothetical protein